MKKLFPLFTAALLIVSCGNDANNSSSDTSTNPSAIDSTTLHPDGTTNGSVISTDTSAMSDNTGNVNGGDSTTSK